MLARRYVMGPANILKRVSGLRRIDGDGIGSRSPQTLRYSPGRTGTAAAGSATNRQTQKSPCYGAFMGTHWEQTRALLRCLRYAKAPNYGAFSVLDGADGETRTLTPCGARTEIWCVYQFHHVRKTSKRKRQAAPGVSEYGVDDGVRTHDRRSHNPVLYQLSYAHHIALLVPEPEMAHPAGLEPATIRLEGGCSIQLSYGRF